MPDPTYVRHYGHAEAVEVTFAPSVLSYRALLELFFQVHDPTTYEQQGSDVGPSYRSAIYYITEVQKEVALATIADRGIGSLARPGRVGNQSGRALLGGGARAPELSGALSWGYSCHFARPTWRLDRSGQ